jgi:DNA-binding transcriptional ArsR family regulator
MEVALDFDCHLHNHIVVHSLNQTFVALSDPTRRMMLDRLRNGSATISQLAEPFGMSQQAISKHLAYLERADLIEKRKEGRQQICTLKPTALKEASDWMDEYRQFWSDAFDRLDTTLKILTERRKQAKKHARRPRRRSI